MSKPIYEKNTRLGYKLEIERLKDIIKEVREYIEHAQNYGKEKIIYINGNDILEILDKVGEK